MSASPRTRALAAAVALALATTGCSSLKGELEGQGGVPEVQLRMAGSDGSVSNSNAIGATAEAEAAPAAESAADQAAPAPGDDAGGSPIAVVSGSDADHDMSAPVEPSSPTEIAAAFRFQAPELYSAQPVSGEELFLNAPAIITFVSPNCPVCIDEGPKLAAAADETPEINYLVIHSWGDLGTYRAFVDESGMEAENVIHVVDQGGVLWERFGITSQPSTVLVDGEGNVSTSNGALGDDGLIRAANRVLGQV